MSVIKINFPSDIWRIIMAYCVCNEKKFKNQSSYYITKYSEYHERLILYRIIKDSTRPLLHIDYYEPTEISQFSNVLDEYEYDNIIYDEKYNMCRIDLNAIYVGIYKKKTIKFSLYAGQTKDFYKAENRYKKLNEDIDYYIEKMDDLINRSHDLYYMKIHKMKNDTGYKISDIKNEYNDFNYYYKKLTGGVKYYRKLENLKSVKRKMNISYWILFSHYSNSSK